MAMQVAAEWRRGGAAVGGEVVGQVGVIRDRWREDGSGKMRWEEGRWVREEEWGYKGAIYICGRLIIDRLHMFQLP